MQQKEKIIPNNDVINDIVDTLMKDMTFPLTIENIKKHIKSRFFELLPIISEVKYGLIFDSCEERQKLCSAFFEKMMSYQIHSVNNKEELIHQALQIPYQFIFLNVDDLFQDISSIFNYIRNEMSKNKATLLYLITSDRANHTSLKKNPFDEKTFILDIFEEDKYLLTLLEVIPDLIK